ncbi:MAG: hypothetical protein HUK22_00065, partial [Thermoguttaceae bacterium]|nr:hypothetical protein [Thermoguttaceae bacterium]
RLGRALWEEWNKTAAKDALDEEGAAGAEAAASDALLAEAEAALSAGLKRKLASSVLEATDYATIYDAFVLAQIYVERGNLAEAENWLNHPTIGPAKFVEGELAAAEARAEGGGGDGVSSGSAASGVLDENFQTAVLALQTSILTSTPDRIEEAEKIMTALEKLVDRAPENAGKLTGVYLRLGKRLEERLSALKLAAEKGDAAKEAELVATSKAFESFLKRAAERDAGNSYASYRWIADSFLALGRGLTGSGGAPSREALDYFAQSGRAYQTILKKIDADPKFAPTAGARDAVSLKIVECLRAAGAYEKAFAQAKLLIKANSQNLDAQLEAARVMRDWGRKDPKMYLTSIVGGGADSRGNNIVWGWNGIIRKLAPTIGNGERYKNVYFDAYLEKSICRYRYAQSLAKSDAAESQKQARDAENELRRLYQTRPDLGGEERFKKFDALFKRFQTLRGEKQPLGLRAAAKKEAAK